MKVQAAEQLREIGVMALDPRWVGERRSTRAKAEKLLGAMRSRQSGFSGRRLGELHR